jgi:hypothetical protein
MTYIHLHDGSRTRKRISAKRGEGLKNAQGGHWLTKRLRDSCTEVGIIWPVSGVVTVIDTDSSRGPTPRDHKEEYLLQRGGPGTQNGLKDVSCS